MTVALFKRLNRVQRGLKVLRKYGTNAHLWLPGIGYLNGQQLGNYLDSAGTTAASVDNPIGLVLDQLYGGGALGSELVVNGTFNIDASGWTPTGSTIASVSGQLQITNTGTNGWAYNTANVPAVSGQQYRFSITNTGSSTITAYVRDGVGANADMVTTGNISPGATYTTVFASNTTGLNIRVFSIGASGTISLVDNISCRQVLGITASQATTANKPTLRRGIVNMVINSSTNPYGSNAGGGSIVTISTPSAGVAQIDKTGSGGYSEALTRISAPNGASVTVTSTCQVRVLSGSAASVSFGLEQDGSPFGMQTQSLSSLGVANDGNWYTVIATGTLTANSTSIRAASFVFDPNSQVSIQVRQSGAFYGALTTAQIQACGGVPTTTTSAASSSQGNWGWDFSPASLQYLQAGTTAGAAGYLGVGCKASTLVFQSVTSSTNTSSSTAGVALKLRANGDVWFRCTNAAASNNDSVGSNAYTPGTPAVFSGRWSYPGNGALWKNGKQLASVSLTASPAGSQGLVIGAATDPTEFFGGVISILAKVDIAVTAADALAIDKFLGVFTGPTGVSF